MIGAQGFEFSGGNLLSAPALILRQQPGAFFASQARKFKRRAKDHLLAPLPRQPRRAQRHDRRDEKSKSGRRSRFHRPGGTAKSAPLIVAGRFRQVEPG